MKAPELLIDEQEMQEWYKSHYLIGSRNVQIMSLMKQNIIEIHRKMILQFTEIL